MVVPSREKNSTFVANTDALGMGAMIFGVIFMLLTFSGKGNFFTILLFIALMYVGIGFTAISINARLTGDGRSDLIFRYTPHLSLAVVVSLLALMAAASAGVIDGIRLAC